MKSLLRSIGAIVVGFCVATIVMLIVEWLNGRVLYPDLARMAAVTNRDLLKELLATAPTGAFLVVIAGWILGGVAGGWITARVAASTPLAHSLLLGVVLTGGAIANNMMIPPPMWFWVVSLLVLIPATYAGAKLASPRS